MSFHLKFFRSEGYNCALDKLYRNYPIVAETRDLLALHGVFVVRGALPRAAIDQIRQRVDQFDAERRPGHPSLDRSDPDCLLPWHAPFMMTLLDLVVASPIFGCMREIVGGEVAIPLSHFNLRAVTDTVAADNFGLHQDFRQVNPAVPFNLWLALEDTAPGDKAGLAFWAAPMQEAPPRDELIAHCSARPECLWFPSFSAGDVALFNYKTPHMTTTYGTGVKRWSAEMRYMAKIPECMQTEPFAISDGGPLAFRNLPPELA
jgi:hypothetical protein